MDRITFQFKLFDGNWSQPLTREFFQRLDSVAVLLYDPNKDCVVLLEQFRVGAIHDERSPWLFEMVAGLIDQDETPSEVAIREAKEEANCELKQVVPIASFYLSPGAMNEKTHLFFAKVDSTQLGGVFGLSEEQEDIKAHVVSREVAYQAIIEGKIDNAISIIALQWLQLHYPNPKA